MSGSDSSRQLSRTLDSGGADMLAVLLESRSRKQRRAGGAALSVAAHLAIIGAAAAVTARGAVVRRAPEKPVWVNMPTPHDPPQVVRTVVPVLPRIPRPGGVSIPRLDVDVKAPAVAINLNSKLGDLSWPSTATCVECRGGLRGLVADAVGADGKGNGESAEWRGSELLMRIVTSAVPRYPERLRDSGIEGSVLVQFAVDTTGRVDMASLKILESTHALFTDAVRDALARFRFRPAEVGGRRVPALAQMPFEFRLYK
jgi:protein TonB